MLGHEHRKPKKNFFFFVISPGQQGSAEQGPQPAYVPRLVWALSLALEQSSQLDRQIKISKKKNIYHC